MNVVTIADAPVIGTLDVLTGTSLQRSPGALRSREDGLSAAIAANTLADSKKPLTSLAKGIEPFADRSEVKFSGAIAHSSDASAIALPVFAESANSLTSFSSRPQASDPSKTLMLIGGGWQFPETQDPYGVSIYLDFLERAGGVEDAKIGIFTTASATPRSNGQLYVQDFEDLYELYLKDQYPNQSIDVEWIPLTLKNQERKKNSEAFAERIKEYTGFIFGGGDQSFITESFYNENPRKETRTATPILRALKHQFNNGAVIAGTSAGTAVQTGAPMITEGESFEALVDDPVSRVGSPPRVRDLHYNPLGGLNLFKYGLLDTHFSERGRQGRIIRLAAETGREMTYGVDENTALIVSNMDTPKVKMEVLGENGVFISDLSDAKVRDRQYWSISGVNTTYLTEGDRFDPLTKTAKFPDKSRFRGNRDTQPKADNIFSRLNDNGWTSPREFTETAIDLFRSKSSTAIGTTRDKRPVQYEVILEKDRTSQGFVGLDSQGDRTFSFANLNVDIGPRL